MTEHPEAAAAGMLAGIVAAYYASAVPGALADLTTSPTTYLGPVASVTLLFGNGDTFRLTCECVSGAAVEGAADDAG